MNHYHWRVTALLGLMTLSGCQQGENHIDPYEDYNRGVFAFNEGVDNLLNPPMTVYQSVVPPPIRLGVANFYANLGEVSNIINFSLQGRWPNTRDSTMRFLVNSSFGCGGIFDMAHNLGLVRKRTDFGETMYRYGYTESAFVVSPFFGPGTVRDAWGLTIDYTIFNPAFYLQNAAARNDMLLVNYFQKKSNVAEYLKNFPEPAYIEDRYVFMRNAYLQYRSFQLNPEPTRWDDFYGEDFDDFDDPFFE